jgi:hypothetical protein
MLPLCAKLSEKAKEDVSCSLPCDLDQWKMLLAFDGAVAAAEEDAGGCLHVHGQAFGFPY